MFETGVNAREICLEDMLDSLDMLDRGKRLINVKLAVLTLVFKFCRLKLPTRDELQNSRFLSFTS